MSFRHICIVREGTIRGFAAYNADADASASRVFDLHFELWALVAYLRDMRVCFWTSPLMQSSCVCSRPWEDVHLYSPSGSITPDGFHWPSKVCFWCRTIVGERSPAVFDDDGESRVQPGRPPRFVPPGW